MVSTSIIGAKTDRSSALDACLRQTGLVASVRHWTLDRCQSTGTSASDVIILDLSRDADSCLAFAARLRAAHPSAFLVGWSPDRQPSAELLLEAMRSGIQEFLSPPLDVVRLKEVLARTVQPGESGNAPGESRLTVITGVKGGAGATTVAVNLGVQLAKLTQKQVALLDFACPLGQVSVFLDLHPRFTVLDAVGNLERLDDHFLSGLLTPHESGLLVLAGAAYPDDWHRLPASALARVVNVAQSTCDFVLIDHNSPYLPGWSSVLKEANTLILVAKVDAPNLANLERHVAALTSLGLDPERLRIVFNRWYAMRNVEYDEALERFLQETKCSVLARLPNDFQQVSQAITMGVPLPTNENDPLCAEFRELARQLAGITPAPEPRVPSGTSHLVALNLTGAL
jgi:pilus assembly protein CpaE